MSAGMPKELLGEGDLYEPLGLVWALRARTDIGEEWYDAGATSKTEAIALAKSHGHTSARVTESTYARYGPNFMADAAEAVNW